MSETSTRGYRTVWVVLLLLAGWEVAARAINSPLLFPGLLETLEAFARGVISGELPSRMLNSLMILIVGYLAGLIGAGILVAFAVSSRVGEALLRVLTSVFNPLPAITLLPLALIWFGVGTRSIAFVVAHSVLWTIALNTHSGIRSVSVILRMVGRNYGLRGHRYFFLVLVPAALPQILTGLKVGWSFAWRTLIAAELVFGVSSGSGGIGWFIYTHKNYLDIPMVFAGLLAISLVGFLMESVVFAQIERVTVRKWGMQD